ncbi:hypothetical protein CY34DRAFT_809065 [Suillus luteus UH-Slu-Lm8-n1]|uniref:Uncharacterized protein n=1 Tax=Suillus luteus UH-Slu-Lm8-n1 TaxID=930992 RepID=A0A0D0AA98_9AGAM|nr:hypothetical protein CY34DRAFT_809065 [Suillus luteus UH-Slu-Lm8-n1]
MPSAPSPGSFTLLALAVTDYSDRHGGGQEPCSEARRPFKCLQQPYQSVHFPNVFDFRTF